MNINFVETAISDFVSDFADNSQRKWGSKSLFANEKGSRMPEFLTFSEKEPQKRWQKTISSAAKSNSTLSLHLAAYEDDADELEKEQNCTPKLSKVLPSFSDSFEFPRQQKDDESSEPEVMQYKSSQKVLNPNEPSSAKSNNKKSSAGNPSESQKAVDPTEGTSNAKNSGGVFSDELLGLELSTNSDIRDLSLYDKTAQVVAIIQSIKSPTTTSNGKKLMKGTLRTESDIIPFVLWNETIEKKQEFFQVGIMALFENIYIRPFDRKFDRTVTVDFEFNIMQNTIITWISQTETEKDEKTYVKTSLSDVCKFSGYIELNDVYVRSLPSLFSNEGSSCIRMCSVTDGRHSFEVRFNSEVDQNFHKGDPVIVRGLLMDKGNPPHVVIEDMSHFIKKPGDRLPLAQIISSNKSVKRRSEFMDENSTPAKVRKRPGNAGASLVEGLSECENRQCDTTVGYGGSPDEIGETTLDAMIIDGVGQKMGAVADLREIKEAAAVAWSVMNHTKHSYIVGNQATEFAIKMGFKKHSLKTELSTKMHQDWLHGNCQPNFWKNVSPDPRHSCGPYKPLPQITPTEDTDRSFSQNSHDTIGMIIIDKNKDCAVGTSTNGARNKIAGRVGDSSIVGAGAYVDNLVGGASATGDGDIMMRFLPSFLAVEKMRSGSSPHKAAEIAIMRIKEYYPNFFGAVIAGNIKGEHGAACNGMPIFQYTAANGGETNVKVYDVKCF